MPDRALVEQLDQAIASLLAGIPPDTRGDVELPALTGIAAALRELPSEDFKKRLKTELQRRTSMTTSASASATSALREGFRTVAPFLIHDKAAELVDFMKGTFGGEELKRN